MARLSPSLAVAARNLAARRPSHGGQACSQRFYSRSDYAMQESAPCPNTQVPRCTAQAPLEHDPVASCAEDPRGAVAMLTSSGSTFGPKPSRCRRHVTYAVALEIHTADALIAAPGVSSSRRGSPCATPASLHTRFLGSRWGRICVSHDVFSCLDDFFPRVKFGQVAADGEAVQSNKASERQRWNWRGSLRGPLAHTTVKSLMRNKEYFAG